MATTCQPVPTASSRTFEQLECLICGSSDSVVVHERMRDVHYGGPGSFSIWRCTRCGLGWLTPQPDRQSVSQYYGSSYVPYLDQPPPKRSRAVARYLLSLPYQARYGRVDQVSAPPRRGATMLDVGCDTGELLEAMQRLGWQVSGIETDAAAASKALARTGGEAEVLVASVDDVDYPDDSFDLVTLSHVLEHLYDPLEVLESIKRWLRSGGQLRIWAPNIDSLESRIFGRFWCGLDTPRHLFHFSPATLSQLLEIAGFQVTGWRPQFQGSSVGGSFKQLAAASLHAGPRAPRGGITYNATVPLGWISCGFGNCASIEVTATIP